MSKIRNFSYLYHRQYVQKPVLEPEFPVPVFRENPKKERKSIQLELFA